MVILNSEHQLSKKKKSKLLSEMLCICDSCEHKKLSIKQRLNKKNIKGNEMVCNNCPIFKDFRMIGHEIWGEDNYHEQLLEKGQDMTTHEILELLEEGITKKRIQVALDIKCSTEFDELILSLVSNRKNF